MSKRVLFRVDKGCLVPADKFSQLALREKGLKLGDIVAAEIAKPRNPAFWRLAHAFGTLCSENIERFTGVDCHSVLKEIQAEAGIECEVTIIDIPGFGKLECKKPKSLSFESMGEERFKPLMTEFSRYISKTYWPSMTEEQILEMAEIMVGD
jgi:hypothetical protein